MIDGNAAFPVTLEIPPQEMGEQQGVENISKPEGDFFLLDQIVFQLRHVGFGVAEDTGHRTFLKFVDQNPYFAKFIFERFASLKTVSGPS